MNKRRAGSPSSVTQPCWMAGDHRSHQHAMGKHHLKRNAPAFYLPFSSSATIFLPFLFHPSFLTLVGKAVFQDGLSAGPLANGQRCPRSADARRLPSGSHQWATVFCSVGQAVPSVPQACPLFASICSAYTAYITLQGHKRPWRPSHASPGEVRLQKKPLNPELSKAFFPWQCLQKWLFILILFVLLSVFVFSFYHLFL